MYVSSGISRSRSNTRFIWMTKHPLIADESGSQGTFCNVLETFILWSLFHEDPGDCGVVSALLPLVAILSVRWCRGTGLCEVSWHSAAQVKSCTACQALYKVFSVVFKTIVKFRKSCIFSCISTFNFHIRRTLTHDRGHWKNTLHQTYVHLKSDSGINTLF